MTISTYEPSVARPPRPSLAAIFHALAALPGRLAQGLRHDELDGMSPGQLAELGLGRSVEPACWLDGGHTGLPAAITYHAAPTDR
ncbi:MAG: hypothetical protein ACTHLT_18385 [Devosia sp.]